MGCRYNGNKALEWAEGKEVMSLVEKSPAELRKEALAKRNSDPFSSLKKKDKYTTRSVEEFRKSLIHYKREY